MRFSTSFLAVALPLLAQALPIRKDTVVTPGDLLVFQFAHVLELLETDFYMQALMKFQPADFLSAGFTSAAVFAEQVESIAFDEMTHASALSAAIISFGGQPVTSCQFNFDSVLTDVQTMAGAARLIEHVGVGAYLGAAHLLSDARFVTTAATILTVEARHSSILNVFNGGMAIPQAFDIPLSPSEVLAMAGGFISGCDLGVPANPSLSITNTGPVGPGTALTFDSAALQGIDTSSLFCNMVLGGAVEAISLPFEQCVVPANIQGPVAISILNDSQPLLASDIVDQSALTTVAGPILAFIDFGMPQQALSSSVLTGQSPLNKDVDGVSSGSGSTDSVNTISPGDASSIASSGGDATDSAGDVASATDSAGDSAPTAGLTPIGSSGGAASGPVVEPGDAATGPVTDVGAIPPPASATTDAGAAPTNPASDATPSDGASDAAPTDASADVGSVNVGDSPSSDAGVTAIGAPTDDSTDAGVAPTDAGVAPTDAGASPTDATLAPTAAIQVLPSDDATSSIGAPAQFNVNGTPTNGGAIIVLGWDTAAPAPSSS